MSAFNTKSYLHKDNLKMAIWWVHKNTGINIIHKKYIVKNRLNSNWENLINDWEVFSFRVMKPLTIKPDSKGWNLYIHVS